MEKSSLSSIDKGSDANEKSVLADVVWLIRPHLCLGLMPFTGVIIGRAGIRYPGAGRGYH